MLRKLKYYSIVSITASLLLLKIFGYNKTFVYPIVGIMSIDHYIAIIKSILIFLLLIFLPTMIFYDILRKLTKFALSCSMVLSLLMPYLFVLLTSILHTYLALIIYTILALLIGFSIEKYSRKMIKSHDQEPNLHNINTLFIAFMIIFVITFTLGTIRYTDEGYLYLSPSGDGRGYIRNAHLTYFYSFKGTYPDIPYTYYHFTLVPLFEMGADITTYLLISQIFINLIFYIVLVDVLGIENFVLVLAIILIAFAIPISLLNVVKVGILEGLLDEPKFFWRLDKYYIQPKYRLIEFNLNFSSYENAMIIFAFLIFYVIYELYERRGYNCNVSNTVLTTVVLSVSTLLIFLMHNLAYLFVLPLLIVVLKLTIANGYRNVLRFVITLSYLLLYNAVKSISITRIFFPFIEKIFNVTEDCVLLISSSVIMILVLGISHLFVALLKYISRNVIIVKCVVPMLTMVNIVLYSLFVLNDVGDRYLIVELLVLLTISIVSSIRQSKTKRDSTKTSRVPLPLALTLWVLSCIIMVIIAHLVNKTILGEKAHVVTYRYQELIQLTALIILVDIVLKDLRMHISKLKSSKVYVISGFCILAIVSFTFVLYSFLWIIAESSGTFMWVSVDHVRYANELCNSETVVLGISIEYIKKMRFYGGNPLGACIFFMPIRAKLNGFIEFDRVFHIHEYVSKNDIVFAIYHVTRQDETVKFVRYNDYLCSSPSSIEYTKRTYLIYINGSRYSCIKCEGQCKVLKIVNKVSEVPSSLGRYVVAIILRR